MSAAEFAEKVQQLLAQAGIDPSYHAFVRQHLDAADADWRWCCGSSCDPCVARLGQVVDAARQLRSSSGSAAP